MHTLCFYIAKVRGWKSRPRFCIVRYMLFGHWDYDLSLFMWFRPSLCWFYLVKVLGPDAWKAQFVAIYAILALFMSILPRKSVRTRGLESTICRYLRDSGPLCIDLQRLGKRNLSLFAWFRPSLHRFAEAWKAQFVAIYVFPALFA